jgi:WD40 repeat protein
VVLYQVSDGTKIREFTGHAEPVTHIAFSPDESLLVSSASGIDDTSVRLTRVADGSLVWSTNLYAGWFEFSPDVSRLAVAMGPGVAIWNVAQGFGRSHLVRTVRVVRRDRTARGGL